ncbi:MAG: hypothetical protein JEY79_01120 [Pseudodesulfovibrio sp.]|nr:hypothetical protein [Pseudodesulfovibrio sp.]
MHDKSISTTAFEWQRDTNDLLGANLVGDVCGKKSYNQALKWARPPREANAQNGPLQHVLFICDKFLDEGSPEAQETAISALRILAVHLAGRGVPVRIALDLPEADETSASMASQKLLRAVSDTIQAGVESKPPALVVAHAEYAMQRLLIFQRQYGEEWDSDGGDVRFCVELPKGPGITDARAEMVLKDRSMLKACFRAIWKKLLEKSGRGE